MAESFNPRSESKENLTLYALLVVFVPHKWPKRQQFVVNRIQKALHQALALRVVCNTFAPS